MDATTTSRLTRWLFAFLVVGLAWRVLRYALQFPIWGDEAMLCLNLVDQDYAGLTQPLRHGQVAPLLFLWSELTSYTLLGASELALRLLPFLAGAVSLLLFWRISRHALDPLPATLAVAILAVAYYPVRHGCEVKPYAFDLLMAVGLMLPALRWLMAPTTRWPLVVLAGVAPLAIGFSYPAVFIAAAVSAVLLPTVIRSREMVICSLYGVFNALTLAGFVVSYACVGGQQVADEPVNQFLQDYWRQWLPAHDPFSILKWLTLAHTGNMLAYPVGGPNGASVVTTLLCIAGGVSLWRSGSRPLLALCVLPFVFSMVAALLHRYPYGGSARLAQHLAPSICILAGSGLAMLLARMRSPAGNKAVLLLLLAIGGVGIARDLLQPFKTEGEIRARTIAADLRAHASAADGLVVLNERSTLKATFLWYLAPERERIVWNGAISAASLGAVERVWCVRFWEPLPVEAIAARLGDGWQLQHGEVHSIRGDRRTDPIEHVQLTCWTRRQPLQ